MMATCQVSTVTMHSVFMVRYDMSTVHPFVLQEEHSAPPTFVAAMQMESVLPPKVAALVNESKSVRRCQTCFEIDLPGQSTPLQIFDQVPRAQNGSYHI